MTAALVAFDLGGVLVDVVLGRLWETLERERDEVEAAFFGDGRHDAVSVGALAGHAYLEEAAARLRADLAQIRRAWRAVVRVDGDAPPLVESVATRSVAWSNTDPEHIEALEGELPSTLLCEARALSYEIGATKPLSAFYESALARAGVRPGDVVFLDDRADNITAARALGIDAVEVRGVDEARAALAARGLLRS